MASWKVPHLTFDVRDPGNKKNMKVRSLPMMKYLKYVSKGGNVRAINVHSTWFQISIFKGTTCPVREIVRVRNYYVKNTLP